MWLVTSIMNNLTFLAIAAFTCALTFSASAAPEPVTEPAPAAPILATLKPTHPRLIASSASWDEIKARRAQDVALDAFLTRGEVEARALLDVPPIAYKKDGRRLLQVSRVVLRRVVLLSMQYRLTNNEKFLQRAEAEMLNVAAFADWNPSHFLDTGEMTLALAFGYDWLYDQLSPQTRQTIRAAIIEKGLRAGLANGGWMKTQNNWNQVNFAGLSLGALAIAEDEPELAAQILELAKQNNHFGQMPYAPAGVYPEGAMYWGYGTTFETVLLGALQSALGTDWGLSQSAGFLQSPEFLYQISGPTGTFFNYSDGVERPSLEGGVYWFAHTLNRPELLRLETERLKQYSDPKRAAKPLSADDRLLPLAALWWPQATAKAETLPRFWYGQGSVPLAAFRSAWDDPNAMYLALKGGKATSSHGHMDAGSFVFESDGVRWARDLGMQDYLSLESKNVDLWNSKQDGGRWQVFRLGPFSHNTLTINGQLHRADGDSRITHFSDDERSAGAIVDLTPVFQGQATRVQRGFAFRASEHVMIRDELEGLKAGDKVRWAMLTGAQIEIGQGGRRAVLTQNGKTLRVSLQGVPDAKFESVSADPPRETDAPNPNSRFLIVNFSAPESGVLSYSLMLEPGAGTDAEIMDEWWQTPLAQWPLARVK